MSNLPKNVIFFTLILHENIPFILTTNPIYALAHSFQGMIIVHITYRLNPFYNEINGQTRVIKESHFYVSDDKEHDTFFM
jgi:hypothetical protein